MGKRIAVVQSSYIPWKGYFDLIAAVDEFVLYDDVQFTKNDWRNRNLLKTPTGTEWLTVPVGPDIHRTIREVTLGDHRWQRRHWNTLQANYARSPHFRTMSGVFAPLYLEHRHETLSALNRAFIESICGCLGITTPIHDSSRFRLVDGRNERLLDLCVQAGADVYLSGPSARAYLDVAAFQARGIRVDWFDYDGYPEYPQLWGPFVHGVSILDLLFNCGEDAPRFMKHAAG